MEQNSIRNSNIPNLATGKQALQISNYYAAEDLSKFITDNNQTLAVLSLNAQSLPAKLDQIKIYLESLKSKMLTFDAICIQETWINTDNETSMYAIPGYNLILRNKTCGEHGGLAIYLKKELTYKSIEICLKHDYLWECQAIEINNKCSNSIILANTYRPPRNLQKNYNKFMEDLELLLEKLDLLKGTHIISGDLNMNLLKLGNERAVDEFFEMVTSYDYTPQITMPTRFIGPNGTLIDNFFVKHSQQTSCNLSGIIESHISDHYPYFTTIYMQSCKPELPRYIYIYNYNDNSISNLIEELRQIDFKSKIDTKNQTLETNYNIFHDLLSSAINKHLPTKKVIFNKRKHKKSNWITNGIIRSINIRDKMYKKLKKTRQCTVGYNELNTDLKIYNYNLKKLIKAAKADYYSKCFQNSKNDIRKTWENINDLLGRSRAYKTIPEEIKHETKSFKKLENITQCFNNFFVNIGKSLAGNITPPLNTSFKDYMNKNVKSVFKFKELQNSDILKIISNLKPKTSRDAYGVSNKLLKDIKKEVSEPLMQLINQALETGEFPSKLKIAKVIPVLKKGDPKNVENYRPISILPTLSKIFEKSINQQLQEYFESQKLFYNRQYGFRQNHSTELAVLDLIENTIWAIEKNEIPISIFIDLTKAFDTIDHEIMCSKLKYYGIQGQELRLFKNYLSERKQFVEINQIHSEIQTISTGVPQGSILGPLMFIIYVNDIATIDNLDTIIYADDTTITSKFDSKMPDTKKLNDQLDNISRWLMSNKLTLNAKKTKFMVFHPRQKHVHPPKLVFGNQQIEQVHTFKFLGIILDSYLSFNEHIKSLSLSIARTVGCMNTIKTIVPKTTLKQIYITLIQTRLYYGNLVWGHKAQKLAKIQKRAIRILSNSKYNAHTEPLLKENRLLKSTDIFKVQIQKFYFRLMTNEIPCSFESILNHDSTPHKYQTRSKPNIKIPLTKLSQTQNCLVIKIAKIINYTDESIINKISTHSKEGFAHYCKITLINTYNNCCLIKDCYICKQ